MKIQVISDVHVEFHRDHGRAFIASLNPEACDVLIIAGDFGSAGRAIDAYGWVAERYAGKQIVAVMGNHELYGREMSRFLAAAADVEEHHPNFHLLDKETVMIEGQRFVGCPLWYPGPVKQAWSDFRHIPLFWRWYETEAQACREFLVDTVVAGDVVVTHMLPSWKCVHPNWVGSDTNCYFVHDVEDVIRAKRPILWVYGHTHESMDLVIGDTTLVANPLGYPHEDSGFELSRIVVV